MKGYIVGYIESWGNDCNPKIIGSFNNWKSALNEAKKLIRPLVLVYIVETEINKIIRPLSPKNLWYHDFKHYIVKRHSVEKRLPLTREEKNEKNEKNENATSPRLDPQKV
jgi:hypothetical protein